MFPESVIVLEVRGFMGSSLSRCCYSFSAWGFWSYGVLLNGLGLHGLFEDSARGLGFRV